MPTKPDWKGTERKVAAALGGRRVPVTGRSRGDAPDIQHDVWSVEVKHKKLLPAWLHEAMAQAVAAVRGEQTPIVILHQSGQRHDNDIVCMRLKDFVAWHGSVPEAEDGEVSGEELTGD